MPEANDISDFDTHHRLSALGSSCHTGVEIVQAAGAASADGSNVNYYHKQESRIAPADLGVEIFIILLHRLSLTQMDVVQKERLQSPSIREVGNQELGTMDAAWSTSNTTYPTLK